MASADSTRPTGQRDACDQSPVSAHEGRECEPTATSTRGELTPTGATSELDVPVRLFNSSRDQTKTIAHPCCDIQQQTLHNGGQFPSDGLLFTSAGGIEDALPYKRVSIDDNSQGSVGMENASTEDSKALGPPPVAELSVIHLTTFTRQLRDFLESYTLDEVVSPHSRILVLDVRLPMFIAIKSLFDYKHLDAILYNPETASFVGQLCLYEVMMFLMEVWEVQNNRSDSSGIAPGICNVVNCVPSDECYHPLVDRAGQSSCSSGAYQGNQDSFVVGRAHGGANKSPRQTDAAVKNTQPSFPALAVDHPAAGGAHQSESPAASSPVCSLDTAAYTVEGWRKAANRQTSFPVISAHRTALEAVLMGLDMRCSSLVVWNDPVAAPLSCVSISFLLNHIVQNLRGSFRIFDIFVRSVKIGINENIIAPLCSTPLIEVLEILVRNQWQSVPLVESDGTYWGCFSTHHFASLAARSLQEMSHLDLSMPISAALQKLPGDYPNQTLPASIRDCGLANNEPSHSRVPVPGNTRVQPPSVNGSPMGAATNVPSGKYFGRQPATTDLDASVRDAVIHTICSEGNRLFFVDPTTWKLTGLITMGDLCRFLVGHELSGTVANHPAPH